MVLGSQDASIEIVLIDYNLIPIHKKKLSKIYIVESIWLFDAIGYEGFKF